HRSHKPIDHQIALHFGDTVIQIGGPLTLTVEGELWVPRMSSGYRDQDFPGVTREDETGPWPSRFSTLPSPESSSCCASADATTVRWRLRSSCCATRSPCFAVR